MGKKFAAVQQTTTGQRVVIGVFDDYDEALKLEREQRDAVSSDTVDNDKLRVSQSVDAREWAKSEDS